jgi:hypothetical protein
VTKLVRRTRDEVLFQALVYRNATDVRPAATGWAVEREGDGDINMVACLENTETSAIGRALANLGFTAARERASAEEMAKASRARARVVRPRDYTISIPVRLHVSEAAHDTIQLLTMAARAGLPADRVESLRARIVAGCSRHALERLEAVLRRWIRVREGAL